MSNDPRGGSLQPFHDPGSGKWGIIDAQHGGLVYEAAFDSEAGAAAICRAHNELGADTFEDAIILLEAEAVQINVALTDARGDGSPPWALAAARELRYGAARERWPTSINDDAKAELMQVAETIERHWRAHITRLDDSPPEWIFAAAEHLSSRVIGRLSKEPIEPRVLARKIYAFYCRAMGVQVDG